MLSFLVRSCGFTEPILAAAVPLLCQKLLNIKQAKEVLNYRTPNL